MFDERNIIQRLAIRQNPISRPRIVELNIDNEVSRLARQSRVSQIEVPMLAAPQVMTTAFAVLVPELVTENLVAWSELGSLDALTSMCDVLVAEAVSENLAACDIPASVDALTPIAQPPQDFTDGGFALLATPVLTYDLADIFVYAPVDCLPSLLDKASIISVDCLPPLLDVAPGISEDAFSLLATPQSENVKLVDMIMAPAIIDIFVALKNPGKAGKSYLAKQAANFDPQPGLPGLVEKRCRHGLPKDQCDICQTQTHKAAEQTLPKKASGARTVDVFDLLLPYLQPPIDLLLANPLLFPAGQRPFDYQIEGIKFLAEREGALLGDEMGLGKTIQTIVALQLLYRQGKVQATLIVCPRSLLGTWERELKKWAPELYVVRVRGNRDERALLWKAPASVYVTNYETLRQDNDTIPTREKFQVIVLDEAQRIKNRNTDIARAVHRLKVPVRWALSGTPLENKLEDVISIFDYLVPKLFPDESYYPETVKQKIAPYFLRRRTAEVRQELPAKLTEEIWLDLNPAQRNAYDAEEEAGKAELGAPNATRIHVFALISRLKQICNIDPLSKQSCKLDYVVEQLESIVENGEKALIFSHLPQVTLDQIKPQLDIFRAAIFDGRLSDMQRERIIESFQKPTASSPNVLLMSVQAGGVGLTLTEASHVFHFDHWWNPAIAKQAEGRAHRIGQQRTVFVHDLYTVDTIEQRIYDLLQGKQALFDSVIDDLSADYVQGKFTDKDLFGLFDMAVPASAQPTRQASSTSRTPAQNGAQRSALDKLSENTKRQWKLADLPRVTPIEFEEFVAHLYERMGYKSELTSRSGDHGIDVIGRRATEHGVEKIIIQCKHRPNNTVGEPEVRDLIGAWQEHRDARFAVLATTGTFSSAAKIMSEKQQVTLIDWLDIERMYNRYMRNSA